MTMKIDSSAYKIPKKGRGGESFIDMKKALLPLVITDKDPVNNFRQLYCVQVTRCSLLEMPTVPSAILKPVHVLSGGENIRTIIKFRKDDKGQAFLAYSSLVLQSSR